MESAQDSFKLSELDSAMKVQQVTIKLQLWSLQTYFGHQTN